MQPAGTRNQTSRCPMASRPSAWRRTTWPNRRRGDRKRNGRATEGRGETTVLCRFGAECARPNCRFVHPEGWQHSSSSRARTRSPASAGSGYGPRATATHVSKGKITKIGAKYGFVDVGDGKSPVYFAINRCYIFPLPRPGTHVRVVFKVNPDGLKRHATRVEAVAEETSRSLLVPTDPFRSFSDPSSRGRKSYTAEGTVVSFNNARGFGFIDIRDGHSNVYFRLASAYEAPSLPRVGHRVMVKGLQGPSTRRHASQVQFLSDSALVRDFISRATKGVVSPENDFEPGALAPVQTAIQKEMKRERDRIHAAMRSDRVTCASGAQVCFVVQRDFMRVARSVLESLARGPAAAGVSAAVVPCSPAQTPGRFTTDLKQLAKTMKFSSQDAPRTPASDTPQLSTELVTAALSQAADLEWDPRCPTRMVVCLVGSRAWPGRSSSSNSTQTSPRRAAIERLGRAPATRIEVIRFDTPRHPAHGTRREGGALDLEASSALDNLAGALQARGDRKGLDEAIGLHRQSLEMRRKLYGEDKPHPEVATSLNNLANALQALVPAKL